MVVPDILCFGKKSQVCGIMAGPRVDEVPDNVFRLSSRLNSTWGGSLADMARCEIILEVIESERLLENAAETGLRLLSNLRGVSGRFPDISNVRGQGLLCAFDCSTAESRDALLKQAREKKLLILPCGEKSIRLRPALTIRPEEVDEGTSRLEDALLAERSK
jgi:L-lysine 6-transaminase